MQLAFCLYKYFPFGGLQRDFLHIAQNCLERGFKVRVYVLSWVGEVPPGFEVIKVPVTALTNHKRYERYTAWVQAALQQSPVDCMIGINKMPGLDIYYAADSCYEEKSRSQRSWIYRLMPRYKHFAEYENAVFHKAAKTEILIISPIQKLFFKRYYQTPESRMHFLPPSIERDRIAPHNAAEIRLKKRADLGIKPHEHLVLMVGSGFIKKGLDRALHAIKSLPVDIRQKTRFLIVGEDKETRFQCLAWFLGIKDQIEFLSGRDDVAEILLAGDLMLHPAKDENAGIVLLEAIVAGLPVLATANCGYGHYIVEAGMGVLVSSPFRQAELNRQLADMIRSNKSSEWREKGKIFAHRANIYSLHQEAARIIQRIASTPPPRKLVRISVCEQKQQPLAFCLFKYFPYGGMQRDFLRIAKACGGRGYKIRAYVLSWQGAIPDEFDIVTVPVSAITNHTKYARYHTWVQEHLRSHPVQGLVGFNKMPGLDVYYAADSCYKEKSRTQRGPFYRATPRYKHFLKYEQAVFDAGSGTEILLLSEVQGFQFQKHYGTPAHKLHLLPPGISRDRMAPENAAAIGLKLRQEFDLQIHTKLLLLIGSGFITKGLDRVLLGMAHLSEALRQETHLIVVGQDHPNKFLRLAKRLGIKDRVLILPGRDDIPRFLLGADLLVHPAYAENAGIILLEAMVAGLPVLATDVCGYAHYITEAQAGRLVESPYQQSRFDALLAEMLVSPQRDTWKDNGVKFGKHADIYSMHDQAAEIICKVIG